MSERDNPLLRLLDPLYLARHQERAAFGQFWCGPDYLPHGKETLIANYPAAHKDGNGVHVYCIPMPARFYILRTSAKCDSQNTTNSPQYIACHLVTGSGQHALAATIAQAISEGRLGLYIDHMPGESQETPTPEEDRL